VCSASRTRRYLVDVDPHAEQPADNISIDQDGGIWSASERAPTPRARLH
jgi:sugar lactone lactonase YvrE